MHVTIDPFVKKSDVQALTFEWPHSDSIRTWPSVTFNPTHNLLCFNSPTFHHSCAGELHHNLKRRQHTTQPITNTPYISYSTPQQTTHLNEHPQVKNPHQDGLYRNVHRPRIRRREPHHHPHPSETGPPQSRNHSRGMAVSLARRSGLSTDHVYYGYLTGWAGGGAACVAIGR